MSKDKGLLKLRDQKLIERFYYWSEIKLTKFERVLEILEKEEFFISQFTILGIIKENDNYLQELREKPENKSQLKLFK